MTTDELRGYLAIARHILDLPCVSDADKLKTVDGLVDILIADLDWGAGKGQRQRQRQRQRDCPPIGCLPEEIQAGRLNP